MRLDYQTAGTLPSFFRSGFCGSCRGGGRLLLRFGAEAEQVLEAAQEDLDAKLDANYPRLSEDEIKTLVVDDKWLAALDAVIQSEMDRISQSLTQRVKELAERYETPLPQVSERVNELEEKVNRHLERMGFAWK